MVEGYELPSPLNRPDGRYTGHIIHPATPASFHEPCVGRDVELKRLRTCLGIDEQWTVSRTTALYDSGCGRVRLEGPPGTGKRILVKEMAHQLRLPLYEMQGYADTSPEDLILAVVPRASISGQKKPLLALQASPLATALLWGGVFYFDAIHRTSMKAMAPLVSLLDGRMTLYSSVTGIQLTPRPDAKPFLFICSTNGREAPRLPEFLDQRTIPILTLKPLASTHILDRVGRLSDPDCESLLEAGREEKRRAIDAQYTSEFAALQSALLPSVFQQAVLHLKGGELLDAFRILVGTIDLHAPQPAALRSLLEVTTQRLRQKAFGLAIKNDHLTCAEAAKIYRTMDSANLLERIDRNNFAHSLLYSGKLDEALEEIRRELLEPYPLTVAWITYGEILQELGKVEKAKECYKHAAELDPSPLPEETDTREAALRRLSRLSKED